MSYSITSEWGFWLVVIGLFNMIVTLVAWWIVMNRLSELAETFHFISKVNADSASRLGELMRSLENKLPQKSDDRGTRQSTSSGPVAQSENVLRSGNCSGPATAASAGGLSDGPMDTHGVIGRSEEITIPLMPGLTVTSSVHWRKEPRECPRTESTSGRGKTSNSKQEKAA